MYNIIAKQINIVIIEPGSPKLWRDRSEVHLYKDYLTIFGGNFLKNFRLKDTVGVSSIFLHIQTETDCIYY